LRRGSKLIGKNLTNDKIKVDTLKSKVHLTQRLLDDKHDENNEISESLAEKREKLHKCEQEFYDKKQQVSKLRTGKTHASIDIDFTEKKRKNLVKKLERRNDIK